MLALISPAKKMDFESNWDSPSHTQPQLLNRTQQLVNQLKQMSSSEIQSLMKLSDKLGELNYNRYQRFSIPFTTSNARPAITAFQGDTYVGLNAKTLSHDDITYAQNHLCILSGLYGLLRPLDLIQAYRLEMGTKLSNPNGEDLYDFWTNNLTQSCNDQLSNHDNKTVISLASNEYIKAINVKNLSGNFITCHFKELKNGTPKTIGLFAKRARGAMARFIIQNRIKTPQNIKNFTEDGYEFIESLSDEQNYVFLRAQA